MGLFKEKKPTIFVNDVYHVVEIDKTTKLPELTGDLVESIKALQHNAAFNYLIQRQRVKKFGMQNTLNEGFNLPETQLRYLQAGIFWAGDLERDYQTLIKDRPAQRQATTDEEDRFKQIAASLDLIGQ